MKTRKLFALVLTAMMLLALTLPAFADEAYSITIKNTAAGHTYEAYQIFQGDLSEQSGKKVLSNVDWGSGVNGDNLLAALKADTTLKDDFAKCESAADVAKVLEGYANDAEKTQAFAKLAGANLTATVAGTSGAQADGKYVISNLSAGYYLVKDKDGVSITGHDAYTRYILQVVGNVEVTAKVDVPTIDKKIVEGEGENTSEVVANTANIGDKIPYVVTSKVPDMTGYEKYFFVVNDTMSKGLTFNNNVEIFIDGVKLDSTKYTVSYSTDSNGVTSIEIVFVDFTQHQSNAGKAIKITYSATLNEKADLTQAGNKNEVYLTYSNNPNVDAKGDSENPEKPGSGDATGETPKSVTKTYSIGIKLTKVDGDETSKKLTGAKFQIAGTGMKVVLVNKTMYKASAEGTYYMLKDGTYTDVAPTEETASKYDSDQKYVKVEVVDKETVAAEINATGYVNSEGILVFEGLDAGTYTITELVAPIGYNLLKTPIEVVITGNPTIDGCTWGATVDGENATITNNLIEFEVENKSGSTLPSTGGMGTTLFYVLGALLAVGAGVLLATRKKMSAESR